MASRITDQIRSYRWRERSSGAHKTPRSVPAKEKVFASLGLWLLNPIPGVFRCYAVLIPFRTLEGFSSSGNYLVCERLLFSWCMCLSYQLSCEWLPEWLTHPGRILVHLANCFPILSSENVNLVSKCAVSDSRNNCKY